MSKVLFFAHLRDEAGMDSVEMDLSGKTVAEVKKIVADTYKLQSLEQVMVAVNEEFASDNDVVQANDTIAFIPPVSGG